MCPPKLYFPHGIHSNGTESPQQPPWHYEHPDLVEFTHSDPSQPISGAATPGQPVCHSSAMHPEIFRLRLPIGDLQERVEEKRATLEGGCLESFFECAQGIASFLNEYVRKGQPKNTNFRYPLVKTPSK